MPIALYLLRKASRAIKIKHMQIRKNQRGNIDPLLIPLIVSVILVLGLAGFGIWSYLQFLDQRDNTDAKIEVAVAEAEAKQAETLEADFAEREYSPHVTWVSSAAIGSIELTYPKTWSGYVDEQDGKSKPLTGFFHPNVVPEGDTRYALRILVDESGYSKTVGAFDDEIEDGNVTAKPITIAEVTGVRLDGQIDRDYQGAMVIFALRDKTVRIWTESTAYVDDFNKIILENLTFEK